MAKVRSYNGLLVDFDELKLKNAGMPTAGNTNTNVAGDIIDINGNVVMKASDVAKSEYARTEKAVVSSTMFDDVDDEEYKIIDDPNVLKNKASKQSAKTDHKPILKDDKVVLGEVTTNPDTPLDNKSQAKDTNGFGKK